MNKKGSTVLKIVIASLFLFFGFKTLLIDSNSAKKLPAHLENFDVELALEDYDYMWEALEENFPLFGPAERAYGVHKDGIKKTYRNEILNSKKMNIEKFYEIANKSIIEFRGIGHLSLLNADYYNMLYETYMNLKDDGYEDQTTKILENEKVQETYKYFYNPNTTYNRNRVNKNNLEFKVLDEGTALVKIYSFEQIRIAEDKDELLDFFKEQSGVRDLIIDVSENMGGSDFYWIENLVSPNIDKAMNGQPREVLLMDSKIVRENLGEIINSEHYSDDLSKYIKRPDMNQDDLKKLKHLLISDEYSVEPSGSKKVYDGNIYVLMSDKVGSATDSFLKFCKDTGFATLIGTRSRGNGPGVSMVEDMLPNSGLLIRHQIDYTLNSDGTLNALMGEEADIISGINEKPLDTFYRVIRGK